MTLVGRVDGAGAVAGASAFSDLGAGAVDGVAAARDAGPVAGGVAFAVPVAPGGRVSPTAHSVSASLPSATMCALFGSGRPAVGPVSVINSQSPLASRI